MCCNGQGQKYSRLRCLLRVKGLMICFYLGWSGSILQFRQNIIQIFNKDEKDSNLQFQSILVLILYTYVHTLGGVKSAFKDPSFAQGSVIFAHLNCHLPEQPFQTLTYMLYKLPLKIQTIEGTLQYKMSPITPPSVHSPCLRRQKIFYARACS